MEFEDVFANEDDEVDGGGISEEVEVVPVSVDSRLDLNLLMKVELEDFLEDLAKVEGVVANKVESEVDEDKGIFLGLGALIFNFLLTASKADFFFFESERISCRLLPSISSSLVPLKSEELTRPSLPESSPLIFIRF